jgi:hypothetical protein
VVPGHENQLPDHEDQLPDVDDLLSVEVRAAAATAATTAAETEVDTAEGQVQLSGKAVPPPRVL